MVDEAHLDVELGELGLPVGAEVFVAKAARDLEVALHAGHHEQLLEQLRRLRQRVPVARLQAHRHQEVARALGRRAGEVRRLDLDEPVPRHHLAGHPVGLRPHPQRPRRTFTPQVEVAVLQPRLFVDVGRADNREGQRRGLGQHLEFGGHYLDLAGRQFGVVVAGRPLANLADHPHAVLRPQALRGLGHRTLAEHHLGQARCVAQVDERDPTEIAAPMHPAGQGHRAAGVGSTQRAGFAGADHGSFSFNVRHAESASATAVCSPVLEVFDLRDAGVEIAIADDHRVARARTIGGLHRAFEAALAVGEVGVHAGSAQLADGRHTVHARSVAERHEEHRHQRLVTDGQAFGPTGEHRAVDAEPEADARQLLAAELGHEAVVATAAADARLRAQAVVHELERRLRVVVEAAHHARVERVAHPQGVEIGAQRGEMRRARVAQVVGHERRVDELFAHLGALVVEHPQRVDRSARPRRLVEVEAVQELRRVVRGRPGGTRRRPARSARG